MNAPLVTYTLKDKIATITMDDNDKNLISPAMIQALNAAFDQADKAQAVVVLTGREGIFSAGFDLKILRSGAMNTYKMIIGGFELAYRLLSYPYPLIIACNGHAIAMGTFLLLSGDYRIGVNGPFKLVANEVAIGLILPYAPIEICRQRLAPAHFQRATLLSEEYTPETGIAAGFVDKVVSKELLMEEAIKIAEQYAKLDGQAHRETKFRVRKKMLRRLKRAIMFDRINLVLLGIKKMVS